jgi:hypothetical protein
MIKAVTALSFWPAGSRSAMRKMKSNKPTARFWTVLAGINVFAALCVMGTFLHVDSSDGRLVAGFALIAVAFLLLITDIVSIVLVYGD